MGEDGKMKQESYFENNMGQHKGGNTISQKQQAYKDSLGRNRIAEERMLNDRGRKVVKQKINGDIEETNHYYNIDDEEADQFDRDWNHHNQRAKFLETHAPYLGNRALQQERFHPEIRHTPQSRQESLQYHPNQQRLERPSGQRQVHHRVS